ncbi:MAG: hypothetical protein QNK37_07280 [Acidobacteriota bacterium]|nr:hypothetical protein [Acidobacteriota bacterium]
MFKTCASLFATILLLLTATPLLAKEFNGKAKKGTKSCNSKFEYDTENCGKVFLSWECAKDLGLGTINGHGTAGTGDDTFDPTGSPGSGSANNGAITYWKFTGIEVCVTDDAGNECCVAGLEVWVVKNKAGSNSIFTANSLLNKAWINGVNSCSSGAGDQLKAYWSEDGTWQLEPPKKKLEEKTDSKTGEVKKVGAVTVQGFGGATEVFTTTSTLSEWTILPRSIAEAAGLEIMGEMDIAGTSTHRSLTSANMIGEGNTSFEVAYVDFLDDGVSGPQSGMVLLNNDENSDFGMLGGDFLTNTVFALDSDGQPCLAALSDIGLGIPHVTTVDGDFMSELILNNSSGSPQTYELTPYRADGTALPAVSGELAVNQTLYISPEELFGTTEVSHFGINKDSRIGVTIAYQDAAGQNSPAHVRQNDMRAQRFRIYPGSMGDVTDGFALMNPNRVPIDVKCRQMDKHGNIISEVALFDAPLAPHAKGLYVFEGDFSPEQETFYEIYADRSFAITALRFANSGNRYFWETAVTPLPALETDAQ